MNPPHAIQLRFPWRCERLADGRRVHRRHFHRPTGLTSADRVDLVLQRPQAGSWIRLNGQRLGVAEPDSDEQRIDITTRMEPRNLLEIEHPRAGEGTEDAGTNNPGPGTPEPGNPTAGSDARGVEPPCGVRLEIYPVRNESSQR